MPEPIATQTVGDFFDAVSAKQPAPGGGAVAAAAGALAAALGRMVAAYSSGAKGLEREGKAIESISAELAAAQTRLLELADEDAEAYGTLNALMKLDADDPARASIGEAAAAAASVPLEVMNLSAGVLASVERLSERCNRWMKSDLAIVTILADAAARAASWMVDANLDGVRRHCGEGEMDGLATSRDESLRACAGRLERVLASCRG